MLIFRARKSGNTVIRVNVEDDGNAEFLTDYYFWPDGVTCRPWLSRHEYQTNRDDRSIRTNGKLPRRSAQRGREYGQRTSGQVREGDDFSDPNPYAVLSTDID